MVPVLIELTSGALQSCPHNPWDLYVSSQRQCWKYALEAIIKWLLLYFLVHDKCLLSMLNCIDWKLKYMCGYIDNNVSLVSL